MSGEEREILKNYLAKKNLKLTRQRKKILDVFLSTEEHISAEELYRKVSKSDPSIGLATVYRTLNLLCDCDLAHRLYFGDGQTRYEHAFGHEHHDHLICNSCGKVVEFHNPNIEKLQRQVSTQAKFTVTSHKLELYGLCEDCASGSR